MTSGWSPSSTATASASPSARNPQRSDALMPSAQSGHSTTATPSSATPGPHLLGPGAEHDHHRVEHRARRGDDVRQQRPAVQERELLGAAEAPPLPRREHEPGHAAMFAKRTRKGIGAADSPASRFPAMLAWPAHASSPSISSTRSSSDAMLLPGSSRSRCGTAARMPRVSGS